MQGATLRVHRTHRSRVGSSGISREHGANYQPRRRSTRCTPAAHLSNQRQRLDRTGRPTLGNRWARTHVHARLASYKASGRAPVQGKVAQAWSPKRKPGNSLAALSSVHTAAAAPPPRPFTLFLSLGLKPDHEKPVISYRSPVRSRPPPLRRHV